MTKADRIIRRIPKLAKPKKKRTQPVSLPMLPLRGLMVFPHMVLHFDVGRKRSVAALEQAMLSDQKIFLVAQRDMDVEEPTIDDIYHVGTIAAIKQVIKLPGDNIRVLVEGRSRAILRAVTQEEPYFAAALDELLVPGTPVSIETDALLRTARSYFEEYCKMSGRISHETMQTVLEIEDPGQLADIIAANVLQKLDDRQGVLEEFDDLTRLESICAMLVRETELAGVEKKVQARVRKQIEQNQKDYYLSEQIKAIQTELGDKDATDVEELRERLEKTPMNDEAREKTARELERLSRMAPGSPEIGVSRTYIEWMLDLPWGKTTPDNLDLRRARRVLAEDHYGLEEVKERVIEYLAVCRIKKNMKGPVLCFVGPPGVGKSPLPSPSPARWAASLSRCRWAACAMRRKSAVTGARISARFRDGSSPPSSRPARSIRCSCLTRSTRWRPTCAAIRRARCLRCSTARRTTPSAIIISSARLICPA